MSREFSEDPEFDALVDRYREKMGPRFGALPGEKWETNIFVQLDEDGKYVLFGYTLDESNNMVARKPSDKPLGLREYIAHLENTENVDVRISSKAFKKDGSLIVSTAGGTEALSVFIKPKKGPEKA